MKVLFVGSGERANACLKRLVLEKDIELEILPSNFVIDGLNRNSTILFLRKSSIDVAILCCNRIVSNKFLVVPEVTINLHGGLIPKYRGSSTLNWQIINGELLGGCAVLRIKPDESIDCGEVLSSLTYPISLDDTISTVTKKVNEIFPEMLINVLKQRKFRGDAQKEGIYWHHRRPEDSKIVFNQMTDIEVYNLVRASEKDYVAYCESTFGLINLVRIEKSLLLDKEYCGIPGRIIIDCQKVIVICKNRGLQIDTLKVNNRSVNAIKHLSSGDYLT